MYLSAKYGNNWQLFSDNYPHLLKNKPPTALAKRFFDLNKDKKLKYYTDIATGPEFKSNIEPLLDCQFKKKKKVPKKQSKKHQMDHQDPDSELGKLKLF